MGSPENMSALGLQECLKLGNGNPAIKDLQRIETIVKGDAKKKWQALPTSKLHPGMYIPL